MVMDEQLNVLCEIVFNLYVGQLFVFGYYRIKFKVYKDFFQFFSDCVVDNIVVKKQLKKQSQIIFLILKFYFRDGRGVFVD